VRRHVFAPPVSPSSTRRDGGVVLIVFVPRWISRWYEDTTANSSSARYLLGGVFGVATRFGPSGDRQPRDVIATGEPACYRGYHLSMFPFSHTRVPRPSGPLRTIVCSPALSRLSPSSFLLLLSLPSLFLLPLVPPPASLLSLHGRHGRHYPLSSAHRVILSPNPAAILRSSIPSTRFLVGSACRASSRDPREAGWRVLGLQLRLVSHTRTWA